MAKRLYYRIKEVADRVGEDASTIRYWEVEFPHIAPSTTPNGTRQYTEKDIQRIAAVVSGRGVFVLALTSNPEGAGVQHARGANGRSVAAGVVEGVAAYYEIGRAS